MEILNKTKDINTVLFYIHETVMHRWAKKERRKSCGALLGENSSYLMSSHLPRLESINQNIWFKISLFLHDY